MPRPCLALLFAAAALVLPLPAGAQQTKPLRQFTGAKGVIRNVAFSPDGKSVAAAGFSDEVRLWNVATGKLTHVLKGDAGHSIAAAFAPDSKAIVTTSWTNGSLSLWDLPKGKKRLTLERDPGSVVHHVAFSPDGKHVASAGAQVRLWDARSGKLIHATRMSGQQGICTVAFSPDGKRLAASNHGGAVELWDVATGKQLRLLRPGGVIAGLAFSPDGARLYTGGNNGYVHEFDSAGKTLQAWTTAGKGVARTLSLSPDGRTLAVSTEHGAAQLWELASLRQRRTFRADTGFAWSVTFAPDGRSVVAGGDEGVVRLWDVTAGWAEPDAEKKPPTDRQLEAYWKDLNGEADVAFTAVWALAAHGKQSVPFLAKKLETVKPPLTAKQIAKLIEQLDDDDFDERQKASAELAKGGATVRRALLEAQKSMPSLEQKRRIPKLLEILQNAGLSASEVLLIRAAEVLGKIDSAEARKLLDKLGKGSAR